ncbi:MAG TPA: hypothetical protein VGM92_01205 [Candidatus Kapabacteria bacterium]
MTKIQHGPKEKFCSNCNALLINYDECPDCAPYARIVVDCIEQEAMIKGRKLDALKKLQAIKERIARAYDKAILLN